MIEQIFNKRSAFLRHFSFWGVAFSGRRSAATPHLQRFAPNKKSFYVQSILSAKAGLVVLVAGLILSGCGRVKFVASKNPKESLMAMYTALESAQIEEASSYMAASRSLQFMDYLDLEYVAPELTKRRLEVLEIGEPVFIDELAVLPVKDRRSAYYAIMTKSCNFWRLSSVHPKEIIQILSYALTVSDRKLIDAFLQRPIGEEPLEAFYGEPGKEKFPKAPFALVASLPEEPGGYMHNFQVIDANQVRWIVDLAFEREMNKPPAIKVSSARKHGQRSFR